MLSVEFRMPRYLLGGSLFFSSVAATTPSMSQRTPLWTLSLLLLPRRFSTAVDAYCALLRVAQDSSVPNLEKALTLTLTQVASKLDPPTVECVLRRSSSSDPAARSALLRFFVWAGLQPAYRHSAAAYGEAREALQIPRHPELVDRLLDAYQREGVPVYIRTFRILFSLCRGATSPEQALRLLRRMGEFDCRPDTASYNAVLSLLAGGGGRSEDGAEAAERLLEEMALAGVHPDVVTYTLMVRAFCDVGRFEDARGLVATMGARGCAPNVVVYSALLDGACKSGNFEAAVELLGKMENRDDGLCAPNVVSYTCLIACLCEKGKAKDAVCMLERMSRQGCVPNRVTVSALLKGLCREGLFEEAFSMVERVVQEGSVPAKDCYSSLAVCLLQHGQVGEAEKLMKQMLGSGVKPDGFARNMLLRHHCSTRRFLDGCRWVRDMWEEGLSLDPDVYHSLLSGASEEGHLLEATALVKEMIQREIPVSALGLDGVVELLKKSGEDDLAQQIMRVRGS